MNVLLIDHHTLVRKGFRHLLEAEGIRVAQDFATVDEALAQTVDSEFGIALVDISHKTSAIGTDLGKLQAAFPTVPILFLTSREERSSVQQAFLAGVSGYLLKTACPRELLRALSLVRGGGRYLHHEVAHQMIDGLRSKKNDPPLLLDEQDLRFLELVGHGYNNSRIAEMNYVSIGTVKNRLRKLFRLFGVNDRMQLVVEALRTGILSLELEPPSVSGGAACLGEGNGQRSLGSRSHVR